MNKLRVTSNGKSTYDAVISAFKLLDSNNQKAGLFSVIGNHALLFADEYVEMLIGINNLRFVKINPLFDSEPGALGQNSISPSEFTQFLKAVMKSYINHKAYVKFAIEPILSLIQMVTGSDSKYCNYNSRKCLNFTSIYPDGRMGICDTFSLKEFPVTIDNAIGYQKSLQKIAKSSPFNKLNELIEECNNCDIYNECRGGCLSQRYYFKNNIPDLYDDYCKHRKEMLDFVRGIIVKNDKLELLHGKK